MLRGPGGGLVGQELWHLPCQDEARGGAEAVVVSRRGDGCVGQALGGAEAWSSQARRHGGGILPYGEFQVDQAQFAVRADHDVARCEIPQDAAVGMGHGYQVHQPCDHVERVGPVPVRTDVAEVLCHPRAQTDSGHLLLGEEDVLGVFEHRQRFGSQLQIFELLQSHGLGAQPVADVPAPGVGLHMRPGLFDHGRGAGADVGAPVDAALVGVPDCRRGPGPCRMPAPVGWSSPKCPFPVLPEQQDRGVDAAAVQEGRGSSGCRMCGCDCICPGGTVTLADRVG